MGVPIHGEPQPDDGWMYSLLLLRIHRACPCPSTAIIGRVIRSVLPHGEARCECTLGFRRFLFLHPYKRLQEIPAHRCRSLSLSVKFSLRRDSQIRRVSISAKPFHLEFSDVRFFVDAEYQFHFTNRRFKIRKTFFVKSDAISESGGFSS
jgi:hypothetical protein